MSWVGRLQPEGFEYDKTETQHVKRLSWNYAHSASGPPASMYRDIVTPRL